MTMIRVQPEKLAASSQQMAHISTQLRQTASNLSSVLNGLDDYNGQFRPQVASRVSRAQNAMQGPSGRLGELASDLERRGKLFSEVDLQTQFGIGDASAQLRQWQSLIPAFSIWGLLPGLGIGILPALLRLGDLLNLGQVPLDQWLVQLSIIAQSNFTKGTADTVGEAKTILEFLFTNKDLARFYNSIDLFGKKTGWIKTATGLDEWLKGAAGTSIFFGVDTLLEVVSKGDYSPRGIGTASGKTAVELAMSLWLPTKIALLINSGVQLGGKAQITQLEMFGQWINPARASLIASDAKNADLSLKKIDLGNLTGDLGSLLWDTEVEGRVHLLEEAFQHPDFQTILQASYVFTPGFSSIALLDSHVRKIVEDDVSQLITHTGDFIVGIPETIWNMEKLKQDVTAAATERVVQMGEHIVETVGSNLLETVEDIATDFVRSLPPIMPSPVPFRL